MNLSQAIIQSYMPHTISLHMDAMNNGAITSDSQAGSLEEIGGNQPSRTEDRQFEDTISWHRSGDTGTK